MSDELTAETLLALMRNLPPAPDMPRWADLTWAQRNMVEREIAATQNPFVRDAMRFNFYRCPDGCRCAATAEES